MDKLFAEFETSALCAYMIEIAMEQVRAGKLPGELDIPAIAKEAMARIENLALRLDTVRDAMLEPIYHQLRQA